jgi:2'-5' RNA ligase
MAEPSRRLFFALWPDAPTRAALAAAALAVAGRRVRRIPAHNLHLTLAFAGNVHASIQACLEAGADSVRLPGFELCIDHCGHFARPRMQWLGPVHTPAGLWELAGALRRVLADCGLEPEVPAFQAHVSIVRKRSRPLPARPFEPVHWSVGAFSLVESAASADGVQYLPIRAWKLESQTLSMG